ncbi:cyclin-dependent protein kinase inhibitor SMR14 [Cornus florida]|uniref:cyclin-dependent protein kinase inhibitor SMR14 n=1 Tax=Cornus florida TaxID=4283 RepID=UPI00289D4F53|nr:cyclin-dependent protein kinase inhibitor SMR14 [Cornus florida]XP_059647031.1 cyclin-dependent protein kinase inhibitor SMR14 [Cornus florida]
MYYEFTKFSFLGMSNSDLFIVKEDQKKIEFQLFSRPTSNSPDGCQVTPSNNHHLQQDLHKDDDDDKKEERHHEATSSFSTELKTPSLGELDATVDEDDHNNGFRTPTSLDHKIPVITQCPPAPRKIRTFTSSAKRKMLPRLRRNLQLDLSKEVESMFPPIVQDDIGRKIKKARRDHDTE